MIALVCLPWGRRLFDWLLELLDGGSHEVGF